MTHIFEIIKDGHTMETVTLEDGTYTAGRDTSCDIIFSDGSVSKKHARITISGNKITVEDTNSVNGIYFKKKPFKKKIFKNTLQINVGPFVLKTGSRAITSSDICHRIFLKNLKTGFYIFTVFIMLSTLFIIYRPLKNQALDIHKQEVLRTGILYAKYLSEINRPYLEAKQYNRLRLNPVEKEDGVVYVLILDSHGRILAPHEMQGDFFDWRGLTDAYQKGKLTIGDGTRAEKIIFHPIGLNNNIIGASVIGFAHELLTRKQGSVFGSTVILLLIILLMLGFLLSFLMIKTLLSPLKYLYEKVEMAIKEGNSLPELKLSYPEVDRLKQIFDRLLIRNAAADESRQPPAAQRALPESGRPWKTGSGSDNDVKAPDNGQKRIECGMDMDGLKTPWCVINCENFMLMKLSGDFNSIPGLAECREGMHVVEAFKAEIIQAVSHLLENRGTDCFPVKLDQKEYLLKRLEGSNRETSIILVFEDIK